jgi:AcrR family transcriptional regulator
MARRRSAALRRDHILDAALELADDAGLDALPMRRLGQARGVKAMSLYNHIANKDAILDGLIARVLT